MIILKLTKKEAQLLALVASNGWGDGDFAEWLKPKEVSVLIKALDKLDSATYSLPPGRERKDLASQLPSPKNPDQ